MTLIPSRARLFLRRMIASFEEAIVAAIPFAFARVWNPLFMSAWVEIGMPAAALGVLSFFVRASRWRALEVSWDREGLKYRKGDTVLHVPWTEYAGHRYTWDIPQRLKVFRTSQRPMIIDTFPLTHEQRTMLLAELSSHPAQGRLPPTFSPF